jgi:hypothetical protein
MPIREVHAARQADNNFVSLIQCHTVLRTANGRIMGPILLHQLRTRSESTYRSSISEKKPKRSDKNAISSDEGGIERRRRGLSQAQNALAWARLAQVPSGMLIGIEGRG